ncbi:hypothetical protein KKC1_08340 [Calderihabitans maritimus]|uniref:Uncharacterized protein n=1 Tax=Calderihabitans maritimus TaxID=1246530 RepID=A0A1Z5HQ69_9FIRM|nr:hypothetical protein KKC1_08340 [Calderihabitans maritimus]
MAKGIQFFWREMSYQVNWFFTIIVYFPDDFFGKIIFRRGVR